MKEKLIKNIKNRIERFIKTYPRDCGIVDIQSAEDFLNSNYDTTFYGVWTCKDTLCD